MKVRIGNSELSVSQDENRLVEVAELCQNYISVIP